MAVGCGMKCIKFLIFFFNFLFLLIGIALIAIGAIVLVKFQEWIAFLPALKVAPIFLIILGIIIFIPAFFGCCGAIRESRCMLITYAVLMGILLLIEVIVAITGFVYGSRMRLIVELAMSTSVSDYSNNENVAAAWSVAQAMLGCCGVHKPSDWKGAIPYDNATVPLSCCREDGCDPTGILDKPQLQQDALIYSSGCLDLVEAKIKSFMYVVCGVAIGIAVVELFGIILAACLAHAARHSD